MRIDPETFPALFHKGTIVTNLFDEYLGARVNDMIEIAQKQPHYICKSILNAAGGSFMKLSPMITEINDACRGILFHLNDIAHCMFYIFYHAEDKLNILLQVHAVKKHQGAFGLLVDGYYEPKETGGLMFYMRNSTTDDDHVCQEATKIAAAVELFLSFAEIETKTVAASDKIWDGPVCAYNNKSNHPVTIVDSSWYTDLVVSGAFNVRGHFRLQPYGPQRHQRRLQWIKDFQKEGYHRKAKKESHETKEKGSNS
jgi:hypothetical protein